MFRGCGVMSDAIGGGIATLQVASQSWRTSDKRVGLSAIAVMTTDCCRNLNTIIHFVTAKTIGLPR